MRTQEEIEELKEYWVADPCYDIEEADGFEEHREELRAFRLEMEAKWRAEREAALQTMAEELGFPGNLKLADYLDRLQSQIEELEARLDAMELR